MNEPLVWQWIILIGFGLIFLIISPIAKTVDEFFSAHSPKKGKPGVWLLTSSLVISWIFAKSITNAANLGLEFGFVGSLAYAAYYLSFLVGGAVIYSLRKKEGFTSIHHFLRSKYGKGALLIFSILIAFRLFNEVWSNTMVIGSYFGEIGSSSYYAAILVFSFLILAYTLKGGLRSSLLTDFIQLFLFAGLLLILLAKIIPNNPNEFSEYIASGEWSMGSGVNLLLVALLQVLSYPFHDPVLTDRGFISSEDTTLKSFILAAIIGVILIIAFSFIGIHAKFLGVEGQAAVEIAKILGIFAMLAMNFIMITSAASTLDSSLSSFSKLMVVDISLSGNKLSLGRWMMVVLIVIGTIPVFANPEILSATTVSGTMVMGLAPVFLLRKYASSPLCFHLPVVFGIAVGVCLALNLIPDSILVSQGRHAHLLAANLWGLIGCIILFFVPNLIKRRS